MDHDLQSSQGQADGFANPAKYGRRQSSRRPGGTPLEPLEWATLFHVGVFVVATSWAFGGNDLGLRLPLLWWGSLSLLITLTAAQDHEAWRSGANRKLYWLIPFALFNAYVFVSFLNPNRREMLNGLHKVLVLSDYNHLLPSSARPDLALRGLWLFDCAYLSCFNLALVIRQRRALRALLLLITGNALVLAVFGTLQRLVNAKGLYFGLIPSPNPYFFSTFIYHNHWGAYILIVISAAIGLFWHYVRRGDKEYRDVWHSPAFVGGVVILFLAATIPLSASRSSTLLLMVLLGIGAVQASLRVVRNRRLHNESPVLPIAGIALILLAGATAIVWLAKPVVTRRWHLTQDQVAVIAKEGSIGARAALYRDTIAMGADQPVYGWGMGSYPTVFYDYNSQKPRGDSLPIFYADAHSDWLQAFAELGLAGCLLVGLQALVPLAAIFRQAYRSLLVRYLLVGCSLVLVYAWVEFPFGNLAVVEMWWLALFSGVAYAGLD